MKDLRVKILSHPKENTKKAPKGRLHKRAVLTEPLWVGRLGKSSTDDGKRSSNAEGFSRPQMRTHSNSLKEYLNEYENTWSRVFREFIS